MIYKTTNLVNNKIYIGAHQTDNLNDQYFGSGTRLKYALKKYGKKNFHREIIKLCENREHMLMVEASIVNKNFIAREDTYNIRLGGTAGFKGFIPPPRPRRPWSEEEKLKKSEDNKGSKNPFYGRKHSAATRKKLSEIGKKYNRENTNSFSGKQHSSETKKHLSALAKNRSHQNAPPPPQRGANNYFSKKYIVTSPKGEVLQIYCRAQFCEQNNLCPRTMKEWTGKGVICLYFERPYRVKNIDQKLECNGWAIDPYVGNLPSNR